MSAAILHDMPALQPPDPPLTDGIVALRGLRSEDATQLVDALRDPDIVRWTRVPADYSHTDFQAYIDVVEQHLAGGESLSLLIVDASDHDRVLGSCGLHEIASGRPDIGYWVARDARGRGVAPRAARLMREYAATALGLQRIEVLVHPDNSASQRAAEKAGFHRTGEYRPSPRRDPQERSDDLVVFAWPDDAGAGGGAG
jgi:RimJ/RimL family protein N-acetyltransferase